jgi:hypothetical protein
VTATAAGQMVIRAAGGSGAGAGGAEEGGRVAGQDVLREGDLEKQSPSVVGISKRWQTRRFVLTPAALVYSKRRKHGTAPPAQAHTPAPGHNTYTAKPNN